MTYRIIAPLAIAATVLLATAADVRCQAWGSEDRTDVNRATALERQARIAEADHQRWSEVASMLREASRLRPANDPIALVNLRTSGVIYGNVGEYARARATLLELANRAIAFGEVDAAAHAYMDVAHVAKELGDEAAVLDYYERAQRLTASSHLTAEQQQVLDNRLRRSATLLASSGR